MNLKWNPHSTQPATDVVQKVWHQKLRLRGNVGRIVAEKMLLLNLAEGLKIYLENKNIFTYND